MANAQKVAYYAQQAGHSLPEEVVKRDGRKVRFDISRIEAAISKCYAQCDTPPKLSASSAAEQVASAIAARNVSDASPHVEQVQDAVELVLQASGEFEAAKRYILHRAKHADDRKTRDVPEDVRQSFADAAQYFPTDLQQFMFFDKYSRYNYDLGRRETWIETVERTEGFLRELSQNKLDESIYTGIYNAILRMDAMPSMRLLATAGDYAREQNLAIFNCSYLPIKDIESFCEIMLISMSGCGVGFSVESYYVDQFPRIIRQRKHQEIETHVIEDSTEGWVEAARIGLNKWFGGYDVKFDYSQIRRAGLPLRRKGGRASGPGPLKTMLDFYRTKILSRQGQFLRPIDAHDMACATGEAAVQGGVRRTAMISLFDWDDHEMRNAKIGAELDNNPVRWNANNSAVWPEDLTQQDLIQQMLDMDKGKRGEPGIFSRDNAKKNKPRRRSSARLGTNPCGEINLRPYGLCNLSIAVVRPEDTLETLKTKVESATIMGTIQSMAENFPGLRPEWAANQREERLLGVDLLGLRDHPVLGRPTEEARAMLSELKQTAIQTNERFAALLGISPAAAITCDKPGGNSSQTLNTASGLDARHSPYYVRNVRVAASSPVARAFQEEGVPMTPENGQTIDTVTTWVVPFPVRSPESSIFKEDLSALDQLEYWLMLKTAWTEHNPSCTIVYSPDEFLDITKWVWEHRDKIGGLSFLPRTDAAYEQMPYEEISEEEYNERLLKFPAKIDFSKIYSYELSDMTTATHELSCFAGLCDV